MLYKSYFTMVIWLFVKNKLIEERDEKVEVICNGAILFACKNRNFNRTELSNLFVRKVAKLMRKYKRVCIAYYARAPKSVKLNEMTRLELLAEVSAHRKALEAAKTEVQEQEQVQVQGPEQEQEQEQQLAQEAQLQAQIEAQLQARLRVQE